ncbi:MAG: hypothetical protein ACPG49_05875 [Chitinophagales bacterium]
MNFKEIFQQITPFLIACPFFILAMLYYLVAIWRDGGTSVMLLPQVLILLLVSVLFLTFDRILLKHGQKMLVITEIVLVMIIYLAVEYSGKAIGLRPANGVTQFQVVYPIEEGKNTELESVYSIPFHRKINIDQNNKSIFLSQKAVNSYKLEVDTKNSYTISGQTFNFKNQTYQVDFYNLQNKGEIDTISELRKQVVWKRIEEVLKN